MAKVYKIIKSTERQPPRASIFGVKLEGFLQIQSSGNKKDPKHPKAADKEKVWDAKRRLHCIPCQSLPDSTKESLT